MSIIHKPKQRKKNEKPQKPVTDNLRKSITSRFQLITDDSYRLAIPVGPRFQADVPVWTDPPSKNKFQVAYNSLSSKWLGTKVWPPKVETKKPAGNRIGEGRPNTCKCTNPGSVECIKKHVSDKRIQLMSELTVIFWKWKFDSMGEGGSRTWNLKEQQQFETIVKSNPVSEGKSFLKPALESLTAQSRQTIVNYYFNVYLPMRMSTKIRSGNYTVDTDDEGGEEEPSAKDSRRKRSREKVLAKTKYLTGHR